MKSDGKGWIVFSMIVLLTAGVMRIFDGLWMLRNAKVAHLYLQGAVFGSSLRTYGWIYLGVGIVLILAALALLSGSELARWTGVAAGAILAISSVWWIYYETEWSAMYVAIGFGVIYGLVAYGGHPTTVVAHDDASDIIATDVTTDVATN